MQRRMRQENSVLFALRDLRSLEADRVADEQRRRDEERARELAERAEAERQRAEDERVAQALAAAEARNHALAATLDRMQATIAALSAEAKAPPPPATVAVSLPEPAPPRARWPLAVAGLAVGFALIAWLVPRQRIVYAPAPPVAVAAPVAIARPPVVAAPPPVTPKPQPPLVARPTPHPHPPKRPAPPPKLPTVTTCNDDPLCGLNLP